MPVYNAESFVKQAIESVLNQTFRDFELIIIDDASTDGSLNIIRSIKDYRIQVVCNEQNLGIIKTRNKGLQVAQCQYIAMMDADDISLPTRFEKQINYLQKHSTIAVLATKLSLIDENNSDKGLWQDDVNTTTEKEIIQKLPIINCIGQPTIMMRADIAQQFGYHNNYSKNEDWGLWLDVLASGNIIAKLDEVLLHYRIHESSTTVKANEEGVYNKIIRFKIAYCKQNFFKIFNNKIVFDVFVFLCKDIFKYKFSFLFALLVKCIQTNLLDLIRQYKAFKLLFSLPLNHHIIFFFPFYHIGGAEIVHTEIVKAGLNKKPLVLFTSRSAPSYIYDRFLENTTILKIDQLLVWPFLRKWATQHIVQKLQTDSSIKLFSSNSKYYYSLLKEIPSHTIAIDLIHAFMHKHETDSPENWSLPVIDKLSYRIIINKKTQFDFEKLYQEAHVPLNYLDRIKYIPNFVEKQPQRKLSDKEVIDILYVGRGTAEKRVNLIAHLAKVLSTIKPIFQFHFVGDVSSVISDEYQSYCKFYGEISDREVISEIYNQCDILILASEREGFPLVIMEAMMHSLIPITTNVGGIATHVNDSNGILINASDYNDLLDKFTYEIIQLQADRNRMRTLSENAYYYAQTHFNKEQFYKSYQQMFSS